MSLSELSLCQLGMNDEGPVALIEAAAAAGFGRVGLPIRSGALKILQTEIVGQPQVIREIRNACAATGVTIFDVESLVLGHEPATDDLKATFETAAEIGASRISCLGYEPGRGPGAIEPGGEADRFASLAAQAAEFDLLVCIEFMAFRSMDSLARTVQVLTEVAAPNGRTVLDALHVQRTGATPDDIAAIPPGLVSHLQLCDAAPDAPPHDQLVDEARSGRLLPGDGIIPLQALIDALPAGTPLALEIPTRDLAKLPARARARPGAAALERLGIGVR